MQVSVSPHHLSNTAFYGIGLTMNISYTSPYEVPLTVGGWVRAGDASAVGQIVPIRPQEKGALRAPLAAKDINEPQKQESIEVDSIVPLTQQAINHLERQREIDKKRDVHLKLEVQITFLNPKVSLSHMSIDQRLEVPKVLPSLPAVDFRNRFVVSYKWDAAQTPAYADMWILSGESSKVFAEVVTQTFDVWTVIKASDWVQDYAPTLGIGRWISMELPSAEDFQVPEPLKTRFATATKSLMDMEDDFKRGDWPDLVEHSRAISELFRDWDVVEKVLLTDGYPAEAVSEIQTSLAALFKFSSKFLHKLDKEKKLQPDLRAYREEAELILALSVTFVNLFGRKAKRQR